MITYTKSMDKQHPRQIFGGVTGFDAPALRRSRSKGMQPHTETPAPFPARGLTISARTVMGLHQRSKLTSHLPSALIVATL